jgi:transposase
MLVVCEATGGYEAHVLEAATELGIEAHKAHGTRVRHFAKYKGLKAKNDPIDARLIALYGLQTENLVRYVPPSASLKALRALKERCHDLQVMLQAETNRLEHVTDPRVLKNLKASIPCLRPTARCAVGLPGMTLGEGAPCSGARGWLDTGDKPRYDI